MFASRLIILTVAGLGLATPAAVSAQDWLGRMARGAARSAVQGAAERAVRGAVSSASGQPAGARAPVAATPPPPTARQTPAAGALPADLPAPRPINYSVQLPGPRQLEFSEADKAAKKAFEEASRVDCRACEGGRAYENWIRQQRSDLFGRNVLERKLGGMAAGEALRWTGSTSGTRFALTVVDTRSIGAWECKQLRWSAERTASPERPGLLCKMSNGEWVEVF